jgi:hypothetical protein
MDIEDADYSRDECIKAIIKHTKLHVEAALKAASEKAEAEPYSEGAVGQCGIDADSILNAYPLTNIK